MWVRGLKSVLGDRLDSIPLVAPCVGAWIEILVTIIPKLTPSVAPCVGAWIEIVDWMRSSLTSLCRTLCGCVD